MKKNIFLLILIICSACSTVQKTLVSLTGVHPLSDKIWDVTNKKFISKEQLYRNLLDSRYILLGEKHDNPEHHDIQTTIIQIFKERNYSADIAFEQLNVEHEPLLKNFFNPENKKKSMDQFAEIIDWKKSGWPSWDLYRSVFQAAREMNSKIIPLMYSAKDKKKIDKLGLAGLEDYIFRELELEKPLAKASMALLTEEIRSSHCYQLPEKVVTKMVDVQRAKDAYMAMQAHVSKRVIFIVGSGHARNEWGIPYYLKRIYPSEKIQSIGMMEVKKNYNSPEVYVESPESFHYVWFTEAVSEEDPCKTYQNELKKMQDKK